MLDAPACGLPGCVRRVGIHLSGDAIWRGIIPAATACGHAIPDDRHRSLSVATLEDPNQAYTSALEDGFHYRCTLAVRGKRRGLLGRTYCAVRSYGVAGSDGYAVDGVNRLVEARRPPAIGKSVFRHSPGLCRTRVAGWAAPPWVVRPDRPNRRRYSRSGGFLLGLRFALFQARAAAGVRHAQHDDAVSGGGSRPLDRRGLDWGG